MASTISTGMKRLQFLCFGFVWNVACGQEITNDTPRPTLSVSYAQTTPLVTADPSDPAWKTASLVPLEDQSLGSPPGLTSPPTRFQVLWDKKWLYIRFRCQGSEIYTPKHGHDNDLYMGDAVEVFLDAKGDGRQVIELEANANNDTYDKLILYTGDPVYETDLRLKYPSVDRDLWEFLDWTWQDLRTAATRSSTGVGDADYIMDIAIPASGDTLKRLGLKEFKPMTMRINFLRYDWTSRDAKGERELNSINWSPIRHGCPHFSAAAMGYLELKAP